MTLAGLVGGLAWLCSNVLGMLPSVFGRVPRWHCMPDPGDSSVYEWGEPETFEILAWVKASERRTDILLSLEDSPKNTSDFATEWGVSPEAVRYHLKHLRQGGPEHSHSALVQDLTPNRDQYKLYGLTESGAEIVERL
jgi:hypothetical protein